MCAALGVTLLVDGCGRSAPTIVEVPEAATSCERLDGIDEVWTQQRREQLVTHMASEPGEWPKIVLTTLDSRVEAGRKDWRVRHAAACEAELPEVLYCLEQSLWQLDSLIDLLLGRPPARAAELWANIDFSLARLDICEQGKTMGRPLPPELARELAELSVLVGVDAAALAPRVRALAAEPRVVGDPFDLLRVIGLELDVALAQGDTVAVDGAMYRMRVATARVPPEHAAMMQAMLAVREVRLALSRGHFEAARKHAEAGAELARTQPDPSTRVGLLQALATLYMKVDREVAAPLLAEAITAATQLMGADSPHPAALQQMLALIHADNGDAALAYELRVRARDVLAASLGVDHPLALEVAVDTAQLLIETQRMEEARHALTDLLANLERLHGDAHPLTAVVRVVLGDVLYEIDDLEGARELYRAAIEPLTALRGPKDRMLIQAVLHLGFTELALGQLDEAEVQCNRGHNLTLALSDDDAMREDAAACLAALAELR